MSDFENLPTSGDAEFGGAGFGAMSPPGGDQPMSPPPPPTWGAAPPPFRPTYSPNAVTNFQSAKGLSTGVKVLLAIDAVIALVYAWFRLVERGLLLDIRAGKRPTARELLDSDDRLKSLSSVSLLAGLVTIVVFLIWFHRSRKNANALADSVKYSTGMAIGSWFIPFADAVMPFQIALGMWSKDSSGNKRSAGIPVLWWAFFLVGGVVRFVGQGKISSALKEVRASAIGLNAAIDKAASGDVLTAVGSVMAVVAAIAGVMFVAGLTKSQDDRFAAATAGGGVTYGAPLR